MKRITSQCHAQKASNIHATFTTDIIMSYPCLAMNLKTNSNVMLRFAIAVKADISPRSKIDQSIHAFLHIFAGS